VSGTIDIRIDTGPIEQLLDRHARRMRYVTYTTLNRTAAVVLKDEQQEMRRVFDRPTDYTLNSLMIEYAARDRLVARVRFKDGIGNQTRSPERWVGIGVRGGGRPMKASEGRLSREVLGGQQNYLVPTKFAPLDGYGNVNRGALIKILSSLRALGDASKSATRRSRGRRRKEEYFAVYRARPGLKPGIYQRMKTAFGRGVIPIFFFAKSQPKYSRRFDFDATAQRSVDQNLQRIWQEVLAQP
jgi:hypothetical protein